MNDFHCGNSLKKLLEKHEISQSQLAKDFGVSRQHISKLLKRKLFGAGTMGRVTKRFEITASDFIKLSEK